MEIAHKSSNLHEKLVMQLFVRCVENHKVIPDTSCSEYPSALEETDLLTNVQSVALRG